MTTTKALTETTNCTKKLRGTTIKKFALRFVGQVPLHPLSNSFRRQCKGGQVGVRRTELVQCNLWTKPQLWVW